MRFEWDPAKERLNRQKHGIPFEEAQELFESKDVLDIYDEDHSTEEDLFIAIGRIRRGMIVASYTERGEDTIRLLSVRAATPREVRRFEDYWREKHE